MTEQSTPALPAVAVRAGRKARFGIFSPDGRRSATWIAWTSKNYPDLYVAPRTIAAAFKVSLDGSGSWQYGLTDDEAVRRGVAGRRRHFDVWSRPEDIGPGLVRGLSVVVPDSELRPWAADNQQSGKPIVRIPSPGGGTAARIDFIFLGISAPRLIQFREPIVYVAELTLSDDTTVRAVARRIPWSAANQYVIETHKMTARQKSNIRDEADVRILVPFELADGTRCFVEAALDRS